MSVTANQAARKLIHTLEEQVKAALTTPQQYGMAPAPAVVKDQFGVLSTLSELFQLGKKWGVEDIPSLKQIFEVMAEVPADKYEDDIFIANQLQEVFTPNPFKAVLTGQANDDTVFPPRQQNRHPMAMR